MLGLRKLGDVPAGAVDTRDLKLGQCRLEPFPRWRLMLTPRWDIPMLGGGPDGHAAQPPVTCRASELERPQRNCPTLGPFLCLERC